ncbi:MAG TPA: hypothetical protein VGX23_21635 [Actinocrinis sp.]|nr:hypothetical protein [Actinocrinis sp.]
MALAAGRTPAQAAAAKPADAVLPNTTCISDTLVTNEVVVHVRDLHTGELDISRGNVQRKIYDRQLAARLTAASR